jgi:hypothetical protein
MKTARDRLLLCVSRGPLQHNLKKFRPRSRKIACFLGVSILIRFKIGLSPVAETASKHRINCKKTNSPGPITIQAYFSAILRGDSSPLNDLRLCGLPILAGATAQCWLQRPKSRRLESRLGMCVSYCRARVPRQASLSNPVWLDRLG